MEFSKVIIVATFVFGSNAVGAVQLTDSCRTIVRKHGASWVRSIDDANVVFEKLPQNPDFKKSISEGAALKSAVNSVLNLKPISVGQVKLLENKCRMHLELPAAIESEAVKRPPAENSKPSKPLR